MSNSFETLWTVAHQAPLSIGFFRQEYWNGLACLTPGVLPDSGIGPASLALAGRFFSIEPPLQPSETLSHTSQLICSRNPDPQKLLRWWRFVLLIGKVSRVIHYTVIDNTNSYLSVSFTHALRIWPEFSLHSHSGLSISFLPKEPRSSCLRTLVPVIPSHFSCLVPTHIPFISNLPHNFLLFIFPLSQWFLARDELCPQETFGNVWRQSPSCGI